MRWLENHELLVEDGDANNDKRVVFRQIGWQGQTGRFYTMDENPKLTEPGSFTPMYIQVMPE